MRTPTLIGARAVVGEELEVGRNGLHVGVVVLVDADARDIDRGYMHTNGQGPVEEAWFHLFGCRRWVTLVRDTRTDDLIDRSP